ncbi:restriction endonuclease subunit S [Janibacter cremeus]|uniref:restriction endonuclease subunit S n=1 Tax=Janibacter cremeus TaxID=1285192 RepID=UPI0023F66D7E|nr:restriction endonuclease subunit S [Janibacter cremeus]WEV77739.1 restriction endonuclease subunit S [Janibacter cremeus]
MNRRIRLQYLSAIPITNGLGLSGQHDNRDWPRYVRTTDIAGPRSLRDDVFASQPPDVAEAAMLASNDIIACAVGATVGKSTLFTSEEPACFAGFLVRIRPNADTDPRFLSYWMQSKDYWAQIEQGVVKSTIENFSASRFRAMSAPYLALEEQRRIADFLDDRVSRIDRIIAARREQLEMVRHQFASLLESRLDALPERVRASRVLRVLPGYAFPSAEYSEDLRDIPLLRGVNVGVGTLRWDETVRWPRNQVSDVAHFRLSPGDVVLGMDRPWIGEGLRIAQVKASDGGPLLLQRVAKLIPSDRLNTHFMIRAFQSHAFRAQIESVLTGLSVPHLSGDQILEYRMPYGARVQQRAVAEELDEADAVATQSTQQLQRSIDLLTEYKSSLITATVTGELDMSTAASRLPG